jgi:hypothetical protein
VKRFSGLHVCHREVCGGETREHARSAGRLFTRNLHPHHLGRDYLIIQIILLNTFLSLYKCVEFLPTFKLFHALKLSHYKTRDFSVEIIVYALCRVVLFIY